MGQAVINTIEGNFIDNHAERAYGGAIMNAAEYSERSEASATIGSIKGNFYNNDATTGGAIYNYADQGIAKIDSLSGNFIGNKASYYGGAIGNVADLGTAIVTLEASDGDTIFYNNKGIYFPEDTPIDEYNDIHNHTLNEEHSPIVNLNASSGRSINFGGTIVMV